MHTPLLPLPAGPATVAFVAVDPSAVDAALLAHFRAQPAPQLLVDCGALDCQRTLGVCYLVSQLLALRQSGAHVWLRNVDPLLHRCLRLFGLGTTFFFVE